MTARRDFDRERAQDRIARTYLYSKDELTPHEREAEQDRIALVYLAKADADDRAAIDKQIAKLPAFPRWVLERHRSHRARWGDNIRACQHADCLSFVTTLLAQTAVACR